jgi:hypothetical protein
MRAKLVALTALAVANCLSALAEAACAPGEITGIGFSPSATLTAYNPFSSFTPKLVTVTVSASASCTVELAFHSPTILAQMTGPAVLNYDVQLVGGGTSLLHSGSNPLTTQPITIAGPSNPGTATVQVNVPAGQVVADGSYSDNINMVARVFDRTGSNYTLLRSQTMPVTGSVAKVCQFTAPTNPTLNFTSAIANGLPNAGHVQSLTFNGVSCTAPTLVRLSGNAMQQLPPASAPPGLDNLIHYRASASFNAASAVLVTSTASEATSGARNTTTGATVNGSISVDVNLLAGKPLLAGTYAATLTVAIDPSP